MHSQPDAGARRSLPAAYAAEHLDHGYAFTGHAAQGATLEQAFVLLRDAGPLRERGYVACTRARTETRLYLIGDAHEREAHGRDLELGDASEQLARALMAGSSERLALEHLGARSDASLRVLDERRRHLEQAHATAEQRLAHGEARLDELGWRGCGRRGAKLRSEVALQRAALQIADEKLAEMRPSAATTTRAAPHRADSPSPRRPGLERPAPERETPGLGLDF